ncbi:ribonuclease III, partial [candidate division WOR-3 bacterium]|nr:ribonuclease III [candidate division WOR-3 bacterium]
LQKRLKISFRHKDLLERALTHPSFAYEQNGDRRTSYERLEFLGDAVYELLLREYFYKVLNFADEGMLSKLKNRYSSGAFMAEMTQKLGLKEKIRLGRSEEEEGRTKTSILANTFEALIGALYLDRGLRYCRRFFGRHIQPHIDLSVIPFDAKSRLNIRLAGCEFEYRVLTKKGEDHKPRFRVGLFIADELMAEGEAGSKKRAEVKAAENYLLSVKEKR